MKKLVSIILFVLTLSGCVEDKTQEQIDNSIAPYITEFNYKGHKYLLYNDGHGNCLISGITHDANCPCHQKEITTIEYDR